MNHNFAAVIRKSILMLIGLFISTVGVSFSIKAEISCQFLTDNLSTHTSAPFYQAFTPEEAYRLLQRSSCAIAYYRNRKNPAQEQVADFAGISRQHMGVIKTPGSNNTTGLISILIDPEPVQYKI